MYTYPHSEPEPDSPADPSVSRALVYLTVCAGVSVSVGVLLLAQGFDLDLAVPLLALCATVPYLVYARLALAQPGAEAVVAGVLLLAVGAWSYVAAVDAERITFVVLPLLLTFMECAVFAGAAVLRRIGGPASAERPPG